MNPKSKAKYSSSKTEKPTKYPTWSSNIFKKKSHKTSLAKNFNSSLRISPFRTPWKEAKMISIPKPAKMFVPSCQHGPRVTGLLEKVFDKLLRFNFSSPLILLIKSYCSNRSLLAKDNHRFYTLQKYLVRFTMWFLD